jgi:hypothetical protein
MNRKIFKDLTSKFILGKLASMRIGHRNNMLVQY